MKKIAILHTVQSVADTFGKRLQEYLDEEVKIYNLWDQFLSMDPNDVGAFTLKHKNHLMRDLQACEETGADLIVVSCSTLTPPIPDIRPFISVPIIAIDEAMMEKAASYGGKILVAATAGSTIAGTSNGIMANAAQQGKDVAISSMVVEDAYREMQKNNMPEHDRILTETVGKVSGYSCIVLAQASMAPCAPAIEKATGIPTLASPALCMEHVKKTLATL